MSTNKTQNYALHAWGLQDEMPLGEVNENFAKLDAALKAEETARDSAVNALLVTGTYTGDGEASQTIQLGFKPRAVLVRSADGAASDNYRTYSSLAVEGQDAINKEGTPILKLTATGFTAHYSARESSGFLAPRVNTNGSKYSYLAVRQ